MYKKMYEKTLKIAILGAECSGKSTFIRQILSHPENLGSLINILKNISEKNFKNDSENDSENILDNMGIINVNNINNFNIKNLKNYKYIFIHEGVRHFVLKNQRPPQNHQEQFIIAEDLLKLYFYHLNNLNKLSNFNNFNNFNKKQVIFFDTTPILSCIYSDYYLNQNKNLNKDMRLWHLALQFQQEMDLCLIFPPNIPWQNNQNISQHAKNETSNQVMRDSNAARLDVYKQLMQAFEEFKLPYKIL